MAQLPATILALFMDEGHLNCREDTVRVISGTFDGLWGTVDSVVCQKSYDYPDEVSPGYHMALEDGRRVTLRWDQVV